MTVRGSGSPHPGRDQAHPIEPPVTTGTSRGVSSPAGSSTVRRERETPVAWQPTAADRARTRAEGRKRGGGLTFLVLAVLLGGGVLFGLVTVLRPAVEDAITGMAASNPASLDWPFVKDIVRARLGPDLSTPASDDPTQVEFVVQQGDTATAIADRLASAGLLRKPLAFVFLAMERGLTGQLQAGSFVLRRNMPPDDLVTNLLSAKDLSVRIPLRPSLRLEQITALLQTLPLELDPEEFYALVSKPPADLVKDYPWLEAALPHGASLEGFLPAGVYRILPDTTSEELVRTMLDRFAETVGSARMAVPAKRGLTFYQVLALASLVEREAVLDSERARIAGVYQNRLAKNMLFQADPTVIYGNDTVELRALPFGQWQRFAFWKLPKVGMSKVSLPSDLTGYQTYQNPGLIPGPIATPSIESIDAALEPDTSDGYLYFVAKGDGSDTHAFAKTYAEHEKNLKKYGYL